MAGKREEKTPEYYSDPNNSIGYLTRVAFRSFSRPLEQRTLEHGVSAGQWRFLRQLWLNNGVTQRELSEMVGTREATTVVAVKSLERSGFVRREKSKSDRRKFHVYLTPKAKELESILNPYVEEVHKLATRDMTDEEVNQLHELLRRVIANLAEANKNIPVTEDPRA